VADETLLDFYTQRLAALRTVRGNWDSQWEEAAARIVPAHRDSFSNRGQFITEGQKKTELQFDSTAAFAAQRFSSVIESLITPQSSIWHLLRAVDPMLRKKRQVREFFDQLSEVLYNYRYRTIANFVGNSQQVYLSLGVYGNGVLYVDRPDRSKGLRYRNVHLGEAYFVENHAGIVDTLYRTMFLDSRQMLQRFGDACPVEVSDDAKMPQSVRKWQVLHVVHPRDDFTPGYIGAQGMAFKSCYMLIDTKQLLREGGYNSFPYAVTRYTQASGETYGRGPAQWVLPAIKVLNEEKKTMLEQGHRQVNPVLLAHDDGNLGSFSLRAGTLNAGGVSAEGRALVHALPVGNLAVNEKMMEMEKVVIKDAFLISLFEILVEDRKEMTATEVLERAREKGMLLAPTAGRIESEFLGPLIEREIDLLQQQGLMPPMPAILQQANAEYKIEYDSPMSRMRRTERASGFVRSLDMAANYTRLTGDPSPLDWYAIDRAMPELNDIFGAPVDWTSTEDEVAAKRQQRSQQQQIQQLTDAAPALATVQKQIPHQTA
jgi:hypothetical protein